MGDSIVRLPKPDTRTSKITYKRRTLPYLLFFLLLIISNLKITAQNKPPLSFSQNQYQFKHLTETDGLAHGTLHCAIMDDQGFMWFGTQDGLSRWDGRIIKNFFPIPGDSTALSGALITGMAKDTQGNIWIVSHQGDLCRLNPETEIFKTFPYPPFDNGIFISSEMAITIDSEGIIWIGSFDDGLLRFNPATLAYQQFELTDNLATDDDRYRQNSVVDIIEDVGNRNILWLAGNNGLFRFNKKTETVDHFPSTASESALTAVTGLWMDDPKEIWLATYSAGIIRFDLQETTWNYFVPNEEKWKTRNVNYNIFYDVTRKSADELWVSELNLGSGIFNIPNGTFSFFEHQPDRITSINSNLGFKVYTDAEDRAWLMNRVNGLSYTDPSCQIFNFKDYGLQQEQYTIKSLSYDADRGKIYTVGHLKDGFFEVDSKSSQIKRIPMQGYEGTSQFYNSVLKTSTDIILVGGNYIDKGDKQKSLYPTIAYYDPEIGQIRPFQQDKLAAVQQKNVNTLYEDDNKHLWIGTDDGILFQFHLEQHRLNRYAKSLATKENISDGINQIIKDADRNQLILATFHGIYRFDLSNNKFSLIKETENYSSRSIALDATGLLWIGTRQLGVQCYDLKTNKMVDLQPIKNAPRTPIEKVFLDQQERLWATTEKGLYLLNTAHQTYYNFTAKDGLTHTLFFLSGVKVLPDGQILLGQNGGYYQFNPDHLEQTMEGGKVHITDFRVNEKVHSLMTNEEGHLSTQLSYLENSINISFSTLSYCQQDKVQFIYKLEGIDPDWVVPFDNRNWANYTNLPPGNYDFKVKQTLDKEAITTSMNLLIRPPLWRTWWAYGLYVLLAILGLYGIIHFQFKRQKEKEEAQRIKELNEAKTHLYTNITHEFRTPLTVILGMTNKMNRYFKDRNSFRFQEAVGLVNRNGAQLLRLVNQMLDLSKLESKSMSLDMEQGDIIVFIKYLFESFESYAESKNIRLHFSREIESLQMDFDRVKIQQIISNLLSNAIKFTPANGLINIHLGQENGNNFLIKVQDTGIGIAKENIPSIFDRFYQAEKVANRQGAGVGTGIGLALTKELVLLLKGTITVNSIVDEGTTFTVLLPITKVAALSKNASLLAEDIAISSPLPSAAFSPSLVLEDDIPNNQHQLLIVEDNPDVILYLKACLEEQYQLVFAQDGQQGIDKAIELIPDIIISDVMMPIKDGFELCHTLKTDIRTSHIPIVLLTAKATMTDKIAGLEHGADAYLSKPFQPKELEVRLRKLIELRNKLQSRYVNGIIPESDNNPTLQIEDEFVLQVKNIVLDHLDNPDFSVEMLCKNIFLSRQQVHRKLIALTGHSTSHFIRSIRLQAAKKLIETTTKSITEIAFDVGFKEVSYFSKVFGDMFGYPPSSLRK